MEMEELIRQAVNSAPQEAEDPEKSNLLFRKRLQEYKEKLMETEEKKDEKERN